MKNIVVISVIMFAITATLFIACKKDDDAKDDSIEEQSQIVIISTVTNVSKPNGNNGAISLSVTGGTPPYSFSWSNGEPGENLTGISAGFYEVTVTDDKGNKASQSIVVEQPFENGKLTDVDGNEYKTVKIGSQWWMAENLKAKHDKQGNDIQSYYYKNNKSYLDTYGRYYDWDVAQEVCPEGWHLPSYNEWVEMFNYLGGMSVAGGKLKVPGGEHWMSPNSGSSNASGFTALGSGEYEPPKYQFLKQFAVFWSATETDHLNAKYFALENKSSGVRKLDYLKSLAYSVRCVQDE